MWPQLQLAEGTDGNLAGWVTRSPELASPSGVRVGTHLATLPRIFGDQLHLYPANPEGPRSFEVDGADFLGDLADGGGSATVTTLYSSFCSGP